MLRALGIAFFIAAPALAQDFFTLKGHGGPIMDIAVLPTGEIATASFDNSVGVWAKPDGLPRWLDGHRAAVNTVLFWRDAQIIVSAGDDFAVRLWDGTSAKGWEIGHHKGKVVALDIHEGTGRIASASWDGTIGLWQINVLGRDPSDVSSWNVKSKFLAGHAQGVNDVAFSVDGATLYSASIDGTIRVWNVETGQGKEQLVKHGFGINELILDEKDGWIAYGTVDGVTRLIDLKTGERIADFTLDRRPILSMAYDPERGQLAVGDGDGFIMVINTKRRKITRDFRAAQRGPIWALAFSPNGQNIHAGGIENTMYSWPVETIDAHGQMAATTRGFLEDPESLDNGERQFKRKCSICHTLTPSSSRRAGPSLHQLFGRTAGTFPDYAYSDILDQSEIVWSTETINALFEVGPDHYIPGTKMPMQRIAKQQDRDDLIDYLRDATAREGD